MEGKLFNSIYEISTTWIPELEKDIARKEKGSRSIPLTILVAKILNKIIVNQIWHHLKKGLYIYKQV